MEVLVPREVPVVAVLVSLLLRQLPLYVGRLFALLLPLHQRRLAFDLLLLVLVASL